MNHRDRVRGVGLLCCHCVRNVAYYRAGWKNDQFLSGADFWRSVNGNFLDIAVLEWCKLFADWNGKHHWRKVVPAPDTFLPELLAGIGVAVDDFNTHRDEIRTYRDKFVAHLDAERVMQIPRLEMVIDSTVFLYGVVRNEYDQFLTSAPQDLQQFYEQRLEAASGTYPNAT